MGVHVDQSGMRNAEIRALFTERNAPQNQRLGANHKASDGAGCCGDRNTGLL